MLIVANSWHLTLSDNHQTFVHDLGEMHYIRFDYFREGRRHFECISHVKSLALVAIYNSLDQKSQDPKGTTEVTQYLSLFSHISELRYVCNNVLFLLERAPCAFSQGVRGMGAERWLLNLDWSSRKDSAPGKGIFLELKDAISSGTYTFYKTRSEQVQQLDRWMYKLSQGQVAIVTKHEPISHWSN